MDVFNNIIGRSIVDISGLLYYIGLIIWIILSMIYSLIVVVYLLITMNCSELQWFWIRVNSGEFVTITFAMLLVLISSVLLLPFYAFLDGFVGFSRFQSGLRISNFMSGYYLIGILSSS